MLVLVVAALKKDIVEIVINPNVLMQFLKISWGMEGQTLEKIIRCAGLSKRRILISFSLTLITANYNVLGYNLIN